MAAEIILRHTLIGVFDDSVWCLWCVWWHCIWGVWWLYLMCLTSCLMCLLWPISLVSLRDNFASFWWRGGGVCEGGGEIVQNVCLWPEVHIHASDPSIREFHDFQKKDPSLLGCNSMYWSHRPPETAKSQTLWRQKTNKRETQNSKDRVNTTKILFCEQQRHPCACDNHENSRLKTGWSAEITTRNHTINLSLSFFPSYKNVPLILFRHDWSCGSRVGVRVGVGVGVGEVVLRKKEKKFIVLNKFS